MLLGCRVRCPQRTNLRTAPGCAETAHATASMRLIHKFITPAILTRYCRRRRDVQPSYILESPTLRIPKAVETSPAGRQLQLCPIDEHDLSSIRPFQRIADQSSTDGIILNIIPFVSVAFIVAENMIKKAALPDRRASWERKMFRESLFQYSYPWAELKIVGSADKKMNVIGHDHIPTNGDAMQRICLQCEHHKCGMHCVGRE